MTAQIIPLRSRRQPPIVRERPKDADLEALLAAANAAVWANAWLYLVLLRAWMRVLP